MSKTTEQFISEAKSVHGDKYDYSLTNYINARTKVKIICPIHGAFFQRAREHLKYGCSKCGRIITSQKLKQKQGNKNSGVKKTTEQFISDSKKVHSDKYDYSLVDYKNSQTKVKIICPIHGVFEQIPNNHLKGHGCKKCSIDYLSFKFKLTNSQFIEKSKKIHNDFYDYSLVNYINNKTKVKIICPIHGIFEQKAENHLRGDGCPICCESRGERKIANFLQENNIEFERQKKFPDCKYKKLLPFDFYIPSKNLLIEFDGKQHYEPNDFFGGKSEFELVKKRDFAKDEFASKNGFQLLRIRYNENVNDKLNSLI